MKTRRVLSQKLLLALLLAAIIMNAPLLRAQNPAQASGAPAQSSATVLPQGVERVTSVEGITEYRLQNGLRVLLSPDMTKPTTTVNITYMVGPRNENYGETGMAHLLEHMMFKGTPKHKNVPQELTEHGARPNGTTWLDRTNYYEPDNANLLVAGKFDDSKTLGLIQKYCGSIRQPARVIQKTYTSEPTQDGEREETLRRVADVQAVGVVYHVPAGSRQDFAAID